MSDLETAIELLEKEQWDEASILLKAFLQKNPEHLEALNCMAFVMAKAQQYEEAEVYTRKTLQLKNDHADLWVNYSLILIRLKKWEEAMHAVEQALNLDPSHHLAWDSMGRIYLNLNQPQKALECFQKNRNEDQQDPELQYRLATTFMALRRFQEAESHFNRALQLRPDYLDALNNLGLTLRYMGRYEEALACFQKAVQIDYDFPNAHLNRATTWLIFKNFTQGWPEFEWRFLTHNVLRQQHYPQPVWEGENFKGKRLFIRAEQGLGDVIQLARYAPLVKERGGEVYFECHPPLKRWFEGHPGIDQVVALDEPKPPFDLQIPIFSIPRIFNTREDTIPSPICHHTHLLHKKKKNDKFKIGINWTGNTSHIENPFRACSLKHFAPLIEKTDAQFFTLQKVGAAQAIHDAGLQGKVTDLLADVKDFMDTAEAIADLDLIITTDTSIAHFIPTLDKPTWILLAIPCDWRWFLDQEDCPWYPSARLFRQKAPFDWQSVFDRVETELKTLIQSH